MLKIDKVNFHLPPIVVIAPVVSLWGRLGEKLAERFELNLDHSEETVKHSVSRFFAPRSGKNHVDFKVLLEGLFESCLSVICESGDVFFLGLETSNNQTSFFEL